MQRLKAKLPRRILGEKEVADPPGVDTVILEGKMLQAKGAWYKGSGEKKLTAEVTLRADTTKELFKKQISASPGFLTRVSYEDENELWSAAALAERIVKEIRSVLK